jgi:hypothetical protein
VPGFGFFLPRRENKWNSTKVAEAGNKKRALELPPDFAARAFFIAYRLRPGSLDFPPEIERFNVA